MQTEGALGLVWGCRPWARLCGVHMFRGGWDPHPGCLHNCADAAGLGLAAGGGRRGGGLPVVVQGVARVARGQRRVAVRVGPVGGVPPVGAVVVLVCVLDVLGRVVVVVMVVGGRALLQVAVLAVVPVPWAREGALHRPLGVAGHGVWRVGGRLGLGRGLPSLTPKQGAQEGGGVGHGLVWARWAVSW